MRYTSALVLASLLSMTGAAFASPPAPAPEIGGGMIGMSLVAGLAYLLKRGKRN